MAKLESRSPAAMQLRSALEKQIATAKIDVPMLPKVAREVMELLQKPEADAAKLSNLIKGDQSLAAHVMRVANSAAYSPNSSLVSLQQAIARLGINLIGEISMAASVNNKLFNVSCYETHLQGIWKHAVGTALWCKEISRQCRKNVEATFLCGLLHSIGRPVVLQMIMDTSKKQNLDLNHDEVMELENNHHQAIAQLVLKQWEMPPLIVESTEYVGYYEQAPQFSEQAATVTAASKFAVFTLYPDVMEEEQLLQEPSLSFLNLYQPEIQKLIEMKSSIEEAMTSIGG